MLKQSSRQDLNSPFLGVYRGTVEALEVLGLSEREASVYVTLLFKQQMKAGDIAKDLKIHRLDAYNILKSLQQKDMVVATLSKPMMFKVVPLDSVVNSLNAKHSETMRRSAMALDELDRSSKRLTDFMNKMERGRGEIGDRLQVISGRKTIKERWSKLLSSAESEILLAATEREMAQFLISPTLDIISSKKERGIRVNVYTPVTRSNADQLLSFKEQIRHFTASSSAGLCVIDRKTIMMVLLPPREFPAISRSDETAVLIDSRSIGEILGTLFFVGWDTSPLIEDVIRVGYHE